MGSPSLIDEYNAGNAWLFASFGVDEDEIRGDMTDSLYGLVLEVGCGTGHSTAWLFKGRTVATDIEPAMVAETKRRFPLVDARVADVHALPFADESFEGVLHFGALNVFRDQALAISEMTRVTKRGGRIVMGDEGLAPWLRDTEYGRILINANPLYKHAPPLHLLPDYAQNVKVKWILGNAFYLIEFTKGEAPQLNLDLPIPGKRGGTLRSRYEHR